MSDEIDRFVISIFNEELEEVTKNYSPKEDEAMFVREEDHLSALATSDARIRELEGQLATVRRDGLNEAAELEVQLGHDLARVCGPDFASGYESGVEALRITIRARLQELDNAD